MTSEIQVERARLADSKAIAQFVSHAHGEEIVQRLDVAQRFSQVSFMLGVRESEIVGLLGWQVENLVVRITDFLVAPGVDLFGVGDLLIAEVEDAGRELQAEAAMLFLPPDPSEGLCSYWEHFGYEYRAVTDIPRAWREAAAEWEQDATEVMVKQLREELVRRPI
jgi:N-acetylglutamate synthase-like GNAT family acetyltransferase